MKRPVTGRTVSSALVEEIVRRVVEAAHDLPRPLSLVEESGEEVSDEIREAADLTPYAVVGRHPSPLWPVTGEEHRVIGFGSGALGCCP